MHDKGQETIDLTWRYRLVVTPQMNIHLVCVAVYLSAYARLLSDSMKALRDNVTVK